MVDARARVDDLLQAAADLTLYEPSLQGLMAMQITSLAMRSPRFKPVVVDPASRASLPGSVAECMGEAYRASLSWDLSEMPEEAVLFVADLEDMARRMNRAF